MSRVRKWWKSTRRNWHSIGSELNKSMLGVVFFTGLSVFVVVGYAWTLYLEQVHQYSSEMLSTKFQVPLEQVRNVIQQAETRAANTLEVSELKDLRDLAWFSAALLLVIPSLLAWGSARRFARPLTQLSLAAHRISEGDFSARVILNKNLERREDEVVLLLKDFNSMAAYLERLEHERRYSLAAIAHELRTPVTVLRGRLEGVRDGVLAASPAEFDKLLGHADLLSKLIEDLQVLSLAEAGELRLERQEFVMQDLLKRVHGDFAVKAEEKFIALHLDMALERARVNADPQRLYQVLSNVLSNALRHTPPHGDIRLQLRVQTQTLTLEIQDSGPGFTPEALSRAFERFYRSPDRGRQSGGSGLGLALSRSLVEAHGGRMELLSSTAGARVRITLETVSEEV